MTIKISSLLISVFFGFFSASGTLLGMNLYEDKHKTEKAEESLYAATLLKDNSAIADAVLKKRHHAFSDGLTKAVWSGQR